MPRLLRQRVGTWRPELRAVGWLFGADTGARVLGQIAVLLTARLLPVSQYGSLSVAVAAFSILLVFSDAGIGDAAVQVLTGSQGGGATFRNEAQSIRVWLASPLLPLGLFMAALSVNPSIVSTGLLVASIPVVNVVTGRSLAARIDKAFPVAALWTSLFLLSQWLGGLAGALLRPTAVGATAGIATFYVVIGAIALRGQRPRWENFATWLRWVRKGRPFLITAGAVAAYSRGDRILIAVIVSPAAAGEYAAAYSLIMIFAIAGMAMHSALLPRLLRESSRRAEPRWRRRVLLLGAMTLPVVISVWVAAPGLINVLYGSKYSQGGVVLRALSPLVALYMVNPFLSSCLIATGRQASVALVATANLLMASVSFPLLTVLLGNVGTAIGSVLVELGGTTLMVLSLGRSQMAAVR